MIDKELIKKHGLGECTTHAVGEGKWFLEVCGLDGQFLFNLKGPKETWEEVADFLEELKELARQT